MMIWRRWVFYPAVAWATFGVGAPALDGWAHRALAGIVWLEAGVALSFAIGTWTILAKPDRHGPFGFALILCTWAIVLALSSALAYFAASALHPISN